MQEMTNDKLEQAFGVIREVYSKYETDEYMTERTHNYICNQLPIFLENIKTTHENNVNRMEEMKLEKDMFITNFLSNNQYFYVQSTEKFFFYDGIHYQVINEDDIIHNVLSSISRDGNLMSWKQLTKKHIMKRIKENNLLKSIPESETIQRVLNELIPNIFANKAEAKYFLTILGDNIFKKNQDVIHFIDNNAKPFITEINNICQFLINTNLSQSFKYKYHDNHEYTHCRLVKINPQIKCENIWIPILNNAILDMICVACHYSIRYANSDDFVVKYSNDSELNSSAFYLKDIQPVDMVVKFISEYLQITNASNNIKNIMDSQILLDKDNQAAKMRATQITWKNMQYLWRKFLYAKSLPGIMFQQTLKSILMDKLSNYYKEELDSFVGICSEHLPVIQQFLQFWGETVTIDETEMDFEIEELIVLFKQWCQLKNDIPNSLSDKQILDLIAYYYPDIEIEKDKYICKIRCSLWDKQLDIQVALDNMKNTVRMKYYVKYGGIENYERMSTPLNGMNISIYDAYNYYCKFFSTVNNKLIVSKSYFEKYVFDNLNEYIVDSKFINSDWILT